LHFYIYGKSEACYDTCHAAISQNECTGGAASHAWAGIERRRIFYDDRDRDDFLERLDMTVASDSTRCYARLLNASVVYRLSYPFVNAKMLKGVPL